MHLDFSIAVVDACPVALSETTLPNPLFFADRERDPLR
jgi:hypothetical protein